MKIKKLNESTSAASGSGGKSKISLARNNIRAFYKPKPGKLARRVFALKL